MRRQKFYNNKQIRPIVQGRRNADLAGLKDLGKRVKGEETGERMEEET